MKPFNYKKLTIGVLLVAIALRLALTLMHTISGDACWHFSASKFMADNLRIPFDESLGRSKFEPFWPSPLFHLIAAFFYEFLGEFGLKLVPFMFGSLSLMLAYLIFKKFLDDKQTFYATLFMSFLPIGIDYSILGYPESTVMFFVILSIYFAANQRFFLSGISAGLVILAKFTGVFVIPTLLFLAYRHSKNTKERIKNLVYVTIVPLIVSMPWFIRNWLLLGNPIWPFLNFIFNGLQQESYSNFGLGNLARPDTYIITYLGFFGVPDGHYRAFFFFDVPYIKVLISIFVIATLIFVFPLFFGFSKDKRYGFIYIFLASFALLLLLFELNVRPAVSRIVLPAIFGLAFIYGIGMDKLLDKFKKSRKLLLIFVIIMVSGFVAAEVIKFKLASSTWRDYKGDFDWIKANTQKEAIILNGGQCIHFRTDRKIIFPEEDINSNNYDYVWINQDFALEPQSIMTKEELAVLSKKNLELVYDNKKTNTKIYKNVRKK
ncbi:MAG: glycosyltransferase family 39 protein [Nanoarchaeota archaeon]